MPALKTGGRHDPRHPALIAAAARDDAACVPAPSPECAVARADVAELGGKHNPKHPAVLDAGRAVDRHCASAPDAK